AVRPLAQPARHGVRRDRRVDHVGGRRVLMAITQTAPTELAQLSDLGFAFHLDQRSDEIADKLGQEGYELADSLFAAVGEAVERLSLGAARALVELHYANHGAGAHREIESCLKGIEERATLRNQRKTEGES